jgi:hypothetical protein
MNSFANDETPGRAEAAEDYGADRMALGAAVEALGLPRAAADRVRFEGPESLPSAFSVTALASAAIGAAALAVSELVAAGADAPAVIVDQLQGTILQPTAGFASIPTRLATARRRSAH